MDDIKKSSPLFSIIFNDGTCFVGKDNYFNTGWREAPIKQIKRIFFRLPDGVYLMVEDFEKYNYFIEGTVDWMRIGGKKGIEKINQNIPKIEYFYIMGLKKGIVTSYRITMFEGEAGKDKFKKGDITRREYQFGKEWNGGETTGWK